MPPGGAHLWEMFWELEETRQAGWGPLPITYREIEAYGRLMGGLPLPWEVRVLLAMDRARRKALTPPEEDEDAPKITRRVSMSDYDAIDRMLGTFAEVVDVEPG
ncbi:phage tail assembly chaperone [Methylobacterium sp. ID0610]|uniref:phage tail assembly chaperone n=1 Tax=Methylobacterium carpenticola TaxID=3344827 RepID=UPI0036C61319